MFKTFDGFFENRFHEAPDITGSGGYIYPGSLAAGYNRSSQNIPYYQGPSIIADIPDYQRDYSIRDAIVHRIEEGRFNMMRVLFDYARRNSAYVVTDVQNRWFLEHKKTPRFYLKTMSSNGGTANTDYTVSTFILENPVDAKRLQSGDLLALMFSFVPTGRSAVGAVLDYAESPPSSGTYVKTFSASAPLPEVGRVIEVNYTTGAVVVTRNVHGDSTTTSYAGKGIDVVVNTTANPGTAIIRAEDAFFIKMTRPLAEGRDDVKVWSSSDTWDYNYCQYINRKWGTTDIRENIYQLGQPRSPMARNKMEAVDQALEELEYYALFGFRHEGTDPDMRWIGHAGGFLEWVPSTHYETLQAPNYTDVTKMGDFTIPLWNKKFENKFYFGAQTKILLCGQDVHTAFSVMINRMTQNIPQIVTSWSVNGVSFRTSSGGTMIVVPSDTMSLNGMSHMAILLDPSTFQYGHLQNMDITIVDNLPSTNIHEKSGEIFGVFTFKRVNPDANWVFVLTPNLQT